MFASWKRRSRSLLWNRRAEGKGNRNDRRLDQPSLAIDVVRVGGGSPDSRLPEEPGRGPLLAVVQRVVQVLRPVLIADRSWQPFDVGAAGRGDCRAFGL